jgi:hypothetical protein
VAGTSTPLIAEQPPEGDGDDLAPREGGDLGVLVERLDQVVVQVEADPPFHGGIVAPLPQPDGGRLGAALPQVPASRCTGWRPEITRLPTRPLQG